VVDSGDESRHQAFFVVRNDELQYSIWPSEREPPAGWSKQTDEMSKDDCLTWIAGHWVDMRPRSARD
jgi:MbtH protein